LRVRNRCNQMKLRRTDTVVKKNDMKPQAPLEISHVSVKLYLVMEFLTGRAWAIIVLGVMTAGCAVSEKNPSSIYFWVAKPVAQTYKGLVPEPARIGIRNFFHNLATPVRFVNCLLQGKGDSANTELRRFVVNTTEGILGFGDPAKDKWGLEPTEEDLGQTLAKCGLGNGIYIVWPLFGPSTLRDSVGMVGDQFLNPTRYVEPTETSIAISAGKITNESSFHIGEYEEFKSAAVEPYVAMREAYIQYRNKKIQE